MASKITQLTEDTSPTGDDVMEIVNDPAGTPVSRKVKALNLLKRLFLADGTQLLITTITDGQFLKRSSTNITSSAIATTDLADFAEAVEDRIGAKVVAGTGISVGYNDTTGETTVANTATGGAGGFGDVVGPSSSTDNALVRFDSVTGNIVQDSIVTLDDIGAITVPEMAAPSTPASGKVAVYAKSDGKLYIKDDAGTETDLAGSGGIAPLVIEDANTVAQRNGTTTQVFRVFRTYTSSTNFEALEILHDGTNHYVQTAKGSGGGSFRALALGGSQISLRTGSSSLSNNWDINSDGNGSLLPGTGSTYDIGGNSKKVRNVFSLATPTLVSADFTKSASTALANVTGLTRAVESTKKYRFIAELFFDADAVGGHKYAIASSGSVTVLIYEILSVDNATGANVISSRQTTSGGSAGQAGATAGYTRIVGYFQGGAGNLTVQFAQNAASGSSSILRGSTFVVEIIEN